ncbi:P-selectin-like [Hippocampus comes]|uniref:P-selectin-like n=1 Tax=Hippocampus comes TaxID=109280 RepID=UPI00094EA5B1|nr:PREDICTED: P-selectin-like [Hippocampus comes]
MQAECWSYRYSDETMTWDQARAWCRAYHGDLVTMKNQEEIDHLKTLLVPRGGRYWIGIRKIDNNWKRVDTNEPVTNEDTNWGRREPNNYRDPSNPNRKEDCVEWLYWKWNDLWCGSNHYALCYVPASCQRHSCVHGECVETVPGHRCQCTEGFDGDKCQHAVECDGSELTSPPKGSVSCADMDGNFAFDSLCHYSCEVGYELSDPEPLRCTATRNWSHPPPTCEAVECSELTSPPKGDISCTGMDGDFAFDPATRFSYGNNCTFSCQDGFELQGVVSMACTHSGEWNAAPPTCEESASQLSAIVAGATIGGVVALSALSLLVWILRRRRREPADDLVIMKHVRH